ncbi:MAG: hypothetical protein R3E32_27525 [Chitinophagales bacterium]
MVDGNGEILSYSEEGVLKKGVPSSNETPPLQLFKTDYKSL